MRHNFQRRAQTVYDYDLTKVPIRQKVVVRGGGRVECAIHVGVLVHGSAEPNRRIILQPWEFRCTAEKLLYWARLYRLANRHRRSCPVKLLPGASRHSPRSKTAHRWIAVPAGAPLLENSPPRDEPLGPQATAEPEPLARPRFAPVLTSAMPAEAISSRRPSRWNFLIHWPIRDTRQKPRTGTGV